MEDGTISKARGPMPIKDENGNIVLSHEGFKGKDIYRAIAGRAKKRADYYYRFIIEKFDVDNPDLSSSGNLEIFVTWATFTCEVYLKSILFEFNAEDYYSEFPDGKKRIFEHHLKKLYEMVKASDQIQGNNYSILISDGISDFEEKLSTVSDYFKYYRYDFEMEIETLDYAFVFSLMKRMHSITDSLQFVNSMEAYQDKENYVVIS